ncbi:MAG: DUF2065 domain-containing protein [Beijerinckiaceae bacterium]
MEDFLAALALLFVIEGLLFAAFPNATRRAMLEAAKTPDDMVRKIGIVCAVVGIAALYVVRRVM